MKLNSSEAKQFIEKPNPEASAVLVYGPDPSQIADCCARLTTAVTGPNAQQELRIAKLHADELRSGGEKLKIAIRTVGLFPGPRVVFVEAATDGLVKQIQDALENGGENDAVLILSAGTLRPASGLRKFFENHAQAFALPIYPNPANRSEIRQLLGQRGIDSMSNLAVEDLSSLAQAMEPMIFARTLDQLVIYKGSDPTPLTPDDVEAVAPRVTEKSIESLLELVASRRAQEVSFAYRRVSGRNPVTVCIAAQRFFGNIHRLATHPSGPAAGIAGLRPPVFGRRREQMLQHVRKWGARGSEKALSRLLETDRHLRLNRPGPREDIVERALLAISMIRS